MVKHTQTIRRLLPTNCLSVFDHFVGLALKGLIRLWCYILFAVACRYYPYHYSPYISDVANFEITELHFDMAQPFRPFEQLLAVLPAASRKLLPSAFQVRIVYCSINLFCASFHIYLVLLIVTSEVFIFYYEEEKDVENVNAIFSCIS